MKGKKKPERKPKRDDAAAKKARATRLLHQMRLDEVLRIRLDGAEFWDIREYVREKEKEDGSAWKLGKGCTPLSDSQIRRYVTETDKIIAASSKVKRSRLVARHMAQRRSLYAKAIGAGDLRTALSTLRDLAEMQGLYPSTKVDLTARGKMMLGIVEEIVDGSPEKQTEADAH